MEIIKTKSGYWVVGYITVLGGPFTTDIQAQKHRKYLIDKWHIQAKY
tara:strand:- start:7097 stop:7237 length:141 start_codon:yes stop_codon:yes gene_type:complete